MTNELHGNRTGLKASSVRALERLYRRHVPRGMVTSPDLTEQLTAVSRETGRQIGVLVSRRGEVKYVVVGDAHKLELPDIGRERGAKSRLRGLRLLHTHLQHEPLSRDDLTDLALLRLDYIAAVEVLDDGKPGLWFGAHIDPRASVVSREPWLVLEPRPSREVANDPTFETLLTELERDLGAQADSRAVSQGPRAVLVQVALPGGPDPDISLYELRELAKTAGVEVVEEVRQRRPSLDPKTAIGRGKLEELTVHAMQQDAELAIFDLNLSPAQVRSIADISEMKVIDRTQLILDIFARRAQSREGKLQVELAQLRYRLPRLSQENAKAFSRLAGGIGGIGPGEQKLEIDRRRVKDRIVLLTKELDKVGEDRALRRGRRNRAEVPVVSIVGYTNAGKSTLLNALTRSRVYAADQLFATLDPTSRRLKTPSDREVIITDTVGFIRDLPPDLVRAFRATLEELEDADLLLHVIDASNPAAEEQIAAVERILHELELDDRPVLRVLNKIDALSDPDDVPRFEERLGGLGVSALDPATFPALLAAIDQKVGRRAAPVGEASYWRHRWETGDTPWDQGGAHPALRSRLASLGAPGSVVVPGCGAGHDALALAEAGWSVTALDFSEQPELDDRLARHGGRLVIGDAFEEPLIEAPFDLWFDHTFFCAIAPADRETWGARAAELVAPGGHLAAVIFPVGELPESGPPWDFTTEVMAAALGEPFELLVDEEAERPAKRVQWEQRWVVFRRRG